MRSALLLALAPVALAQVRLLYQNDLSLDSNATSALFIPGTTRGDQISAACSPYNEQPLSDITQGLKDQLNYLVFKGILQNSSDIYIGGGSSASLRFKRQSTCEIYNVGLGLATSGNCTQELVSSNRQNGNYTRALTQYLRTAHPLHKQRSPL